MELIRGRFPGRPLPADRLERIGAAGPRSLGHTARFVVDHSPCPVLLLRHSQDASPKRD
jgi:hypothetical protein